MNAVAGCLPACPRQHRPFSTAHGDKVVTSFESAVRLAHHRVEDGRGRQRISRHVGWVFYRGVWIVQDIR